MSKAGVLAKDGYDEAMLAAALSDLGYKLFFSQETASTMNQIIDAANKGNEGRVVALTNHQVHGVGREARAWNDIPGRSLMFSVLFHIPQENVAVFADLIALTLADVLRLKTGCEVKIKYPNDLVIDDKKAGGILVKNIYDDKLNYMGTNVGIGMNVHYTQNELEKFQTEYPAAALDLESKLSISRQGLLVDILRALRYLETEIKVISANSTALALVDKRWLGLSSVYGREIAILKNGRIVDQGRVVNTKIGQGVEIESTNGTKWFSLYETDMKLRMIN